MMGVTFELIDAPYPYLCAVYRCDCGGCATLYGQDSGDLPVGWRALPDVAGERRVMCPGCAARAELPPPL